MELGPTFSWSPLTKDQIKQAKKTLWGGVFRQEYGAEWWSFDEHFVMDESGVLRHYLKGQRII